MSKLVDELMFRIFQRNPSRAGDFSKISRISNYLFVVSTLQNSSIDEQLIKHVKQLMPISVLKNKRNENNGSNGAHEKLIKFEMMGKLVGGMREMLLTTSRQYSHRRQNAQPMTSRPMRNDRNHSH